MNACQRAVCTFVVLLTAAVAAAGDWPQYKRDSARRGDHPEATLQFPLTRTTAIRFPAPIYASPAVVAGRVYLQDARGRVACIDAAANRVVWLTSIGGINNISSPAVADGVVYIGSTAEKFCLLDAATGKLLKEIAAPGGVLAAPAVTDDAVYFSTFAGQLTKLDRQGNVVWSFDGGRTSITEFAVSGDRIAFFAGTSAVVLYDLKDLGSRVEVLSDKPAPSQCSPVGGPLLAEEGKPIFQSYDSEYARFYVGSTIVQTDSNDSRIAPSQRGDRIYRGDRCWRLGSSGASYLWKVDPGTLHDGGFHSSPALAKDVLVVGSELGRVYCFPLDGDEKVRKPVWEFATLRAGQPNSAVSSSPAVVEGAIYFGGEDGVLYGLSQGTEAPLVDAPVSASETTVAAAPLSGGEWPLPGGDLGFSCVAGETSLQPPYDVRWRTRVWSTFKCPMIVADQKVFASGRMGPLMALHAATGEILWKVHHPNVESRAAPAYADGRIYLMRIQGGLKASPYVLGWNGSPGGAGVWCHDAQTGQLLWNVPMNFAYHFNPDTLTVVDGKVFSCRLGDEGRFDAVALDAATGKELWTQTIAEFTPSKTLEPRRFSNVVADGVLCVSFSGLADRRGKIESPGATLGLEPGSGKILWRNEEAAIAIRSRIAARKGTLVVFNPVTGMHALDPKTGEQQWHKPSEDRIYMHALTDLFLDSQGKAGTFDEHQCSYKIFINGLWYSHGGSGENFQYVRRFTDSGKPETVFKRGFLSNACPSPAPAYEHLYFAPNGEGVIYCFAGAQEKSTSAPAK